MIVGGIVHVPGDKSISHRALILAALADGESHIHGILQSADIESTASVLRALGVAVPPLGANIAIVGKGRRGLTAPARDLDCGNSGTTARLMAGVVAGQSFRARFTGDESLSRRPMARVARPLEAMGARVTFEDGEHLPMTVQGGTLRRSSGRPRPRARRRRARCCSPVSWPACRWCCASPAVRATIPSGCCAPRAWTWMLWAMSCASSPWLGWRRSISACPGDPSSAAFMTALAVLAGGGALSVADVCLNPTRIGFYRALQQMGAHIDFHVSAPQGGEDIGSIFAWPSGLHAVEVGADTVPSMIDELPLLACVAARASGVTVITGAAELRAKESDRISAVVSNLRAIGIAAEERPDGMTVTGSDAPLSGAVITHGDHRIAMAFGVLAALPESTITIDDRDCVAVSYPSFWEDMRAAITA